MKEDDNYDEDGRNEETGYQADTNEDEEEQQG